MELGWSISYSGAAQPAMGMETWKGVVAFVAPEAALAACTTREVQEAVPVRQHPDTFRQRSCDYRPTALGTETTVKVHLVPGSTPMLVARTRLEYWSLVIEALVKRLDAGRQRPLHVGLDQRLTDAISIALLCTTIPVKVCMTKSIHSMKLSQPSRRKRGNQQRRMRPQRRNWGWSKKAENFPVVDDEAEAYVDAEVFFWTSRGSRCVGGRHTCGKPSNTHSRREARARVARSTVRRWSVTRRC